MPTSSLAFFSLCIVAALAIQLLPSLRLRYAAIAIISVLFFASHMPSVSAAIPLIGFLVLGYLAILLCAYTRRRSVFYLTIAVVLGVFIYLKQYSIIPESSLLQVSYTAVGMSYILFRVLQLLIDQDGGTIEHPISPLNYLCFTIFYPTFLAGPIMRYQAFTTAVADSFRSLSEDEIRSSLLRAIMGLVKISLVGAVLFKVQTSVAALMDGNNPSLAQLLIFAAACVLFFYYVYYNFSGYMDIVIGFAGLSGIILPENFNRPFRSENFLDFWSRWHITLSEWLKAYVFYPYLTAMTRRWPQRNMLWFTSGSAFFITYFFVGMWHGTTFLYLIYALTQAAAALANSSWQNAMRSRLGKNGYAALKANPLYIYSCRGLTLGFVSVSLVCVWGNEATFSNWYPLLAPAWLLLAAVFTVATFVWDQVASRLKRIALFHPGVYSRYALLGGAGVLAIIILIVSEGAPVSVYQNF